MIKIEHLSKSFNGQTILDDVSFEIAKGEIICLLGESGTGKSVLLKHLMGLFKPDQGHVFIDGEDITRLNEKALLGVRKQIGYLFQEGALYDFMDVFDNIAFPLKEHTRLNEKQVKEKVQNILELIDLKGVENKLPAELSGGMKKRVGLARAIILDSKIIFCDEPTSGLDPIRSRDITDLIKNVANRLGCTCVITSHDMANAFRIADRLILLRNGKVIFNGPKEEISKQLDPFIHEFVSGK